MRNVWYKESLGYLFIEERAVKVNTTYWLSVPTIISKPEIFIVLINNTCFRKIKTMLYG